jgi:hypothetical protein
VAAQTIERPLAVLRSSPSAVVDDASGETVRETMLDAARQLRRCRPDLSDRIETAVAALP